MSRGAVGADAGIVLREGGSKSKVEHINMLRTVALRYVRYERTVKMYRVYTSLYTANPRKSEISKNF